jgi:hypothetical protein
MGLQFIKLIVFRLWGHTAPLFFYFDSPFLVKKLSDISIMPIIPHEPFRVCQSKSERLK